MQVACTQKVNLWACSHLVSWTEAALHPEPSQNTPSQTLDHGGHGASTLNPKLQPRDSAPQTPNLKPQTLDPQPSTLNPIPQTTDPKPSNSNPKPNSQLLHLNPRPGHCDVGEVWGRKFATGCREVLPKHISSMQKFASDISHA